MTGVPAHATGGPAHGRRTAGPVPGTAGGPAAGSGRTGAAGIAAMAAMGGTPRSRRTGGRTDTSRETAAPTGEAGRPLEADPAAPPRLWNIANALTMLRLLLVPGFAVLLLHGDGHDPVWRSFAWAAFAVAMITDLFDGELARRHNLVTDFGKIADPIADKAIMGAALLGLSVLNDLPWWVTGVILLRELGITLMRFWVIRQAVIPASRGGKLKTLTQGVAVGMYVLILTGPLASLRAWFMAAAVVMTVATGLDYVRQVITLRREALRPTGASASGGSAGSGAAVASGGSAESGAEVASGGSAESGAAVASVGGDPVTETADGDLVTAYREVAGGDVAALGGTDESEPQEGGPTAPARVLPAGATASGAQRPAPGGTAPGATEGATGTNGAGRPEA